MELLCVYSYRDVKITGYRFSGKLMLWHFFLDLSAVHLLCELTFENSQQPVLILQLSEGKYNKFLEYLTYMRQELEFFSYICNPCCIFGLGPKFSPQSVKPTASRLKNGKCPKITQIRCILGRSHTLHRVMAVMFFGLDPNFHGNPLGPPRRGSKKENGQKPPK